MKPNPKRAGAWMPATLGLALLGLTLVGADARPESQPSGLEPSPPELSQPVDRVLIVSIDGLGPDVLRESFAPNLRGLMARGSYTLSALTTQTVKTLPSHVSMLTGVTPEKHGVTWNDAFHGYPKVPTLMEVVKRDRPGLTTALVAGKPKFRTFLRSGVDWSFVPEADDVSDAEVARRATALIREHQPNLLVVHLPNVDQVGHALGWGSLEQRAAVARADRAVGQVLQALRRAGVLEQTAIIVTADHGGVGRNHVPEDGKSIRIPWIISGPGVRHGFDLGTVAGEEVHTEDTFATASWLLGLPLDAAVDGRPVTRVLAAAARRP
ncbi:MAG TPA: alkaline phosphatase family protein [Myxococcales bacterium]|jgi:hypothetical protein